MVFNSKVTRAIRIGSLVALHVEIEERQDELPEHVGILLVVFANHDAKDSGPKARQKTKSQLHTLLESKLQGVDKNGGTLEDLLGVVGRGTRATESVLGNTIGTKHEVEPSLGGLQKDRPQVRLAPNLLACDGIGINLKMVV